jgi:hypothetical protein
MLQLPGCLPEESEIVSNSATVLLQLPVLLRVPSMKMHVSLHAHVPLLKIYQVVISLI